MKKILSLIAFSFIGIAASLAQDSEGGIPLSFERKNLSGEIDFVQVQAPIYSSLAEYDSFQAKRNAPYRIGVTVPIDYNLTNSGTWTDLPELDAKLWRLTIKCSGAKSIGFGYGSFYLPKGAKLYLYNKSKSMLIGAYTEDNNTENAYFSTQRVFGDEITLELFLPNAVSGKAKLNITELNYFYRNGEFEKAGSGACEVNVICSPEGDNWQFQRNGVVLLDIRVGGTSGNWFNCTGSLVNNTAQNCTPYVLLADHCHYDNAYATTADYNAWVFHFHYQATTCTGTTGNLSAYTKTGCALKAHDTYGSNGTGSDFCLVQINSAIASTFNVYYNGWDRTNTASASGVSIHHPSADIMKISTYTSPLTSINYGGTGTHWQVVWAGTTNGHGVTEGGSSGSPIFNPSGNIVGTLTGGGSLCTALTSPDAYGKIYYHWDQNGATSATRLKDWLDPNNTGATVLAGKATCSAGVLENTLTEEKVLIYPSPAYTEISIEVKSDSKVIENLSIYNIMGVLVKNIPSLHIESGKATINISELAEGLYFLTAKKDKSTLKGEFIKAK